MGMVLARLFAWAGGQSGDDVVDDPVPSQREAADAAEASRKRRAHAISLRLAEQAAAERRKARLASEAWADVEQDLKAPVVDAMSQPVLTEGEMYEQMDVCVYGEPGAGAYAFRKLICGVDQGVAVGSRGFLVNRGRTKVVMQFRVCETPTFKPTGAACYVFVFDDSNLASFNKIDTEYVAAASANGRQGAATFLIANVTSGSPLVSEQDKDRLAGDVSAVSIYQTEENKAGFRHASFPLSPVDAEDVADSCRDAVEVMLGVAEAMHLLRLFTIKRKPYAA